MQIDQETKATSMIEDGVTTYTPFVPTRPKIVCLCGSTRFKSIFEKLQKEETLKGNIILTVGFFQHAESERLRDLIGPDRPTDEEKRLCQGDKEKVLGNEVAAALDELHLRKIDLADEVFIINPGQYIGLSTLKEIRYAELHNKSIRYLTREQPEYLRNMATGGLSGR